MPKETLSEPDASIQATVKKKFTPEVIFLCIVLALGALLRLWHIGWGLPHLYEEATPLHISWRFWNWGKSGFDFNPDVFTYPAFTFYLQFVIQGIHYLIGHVVGSYSNLDAFQQSFSADPTNVFTVARFTTVCFDLGTIIVAYLMVKRFADDRAALLAASLITLNPLHIAQAHLINVDTPLAFFTLLSVYFILEMHRSPSRKSYILAGVSIGLAAATKYNGAFLLLVLVVAHMMMSDSLKNGFRSFMSPSLILAVLTSCLTFVALNPYIFLRFEKFLSDFNTVQEHMEFGHLGVDPQVNTFAYYALNSLPEQLGSLMFVVSIISAFHLTIKKNKKNIILLTFPILYIAVIGSWKMRAERYIFPAVPFLIIIGSIGIMKLKEYVTEHSLRTKAFTIFKAQPLRTVLLILVAALIGVQPTLSTYRYLHSLGLPDTRTVVKDWIKSHLAAGSAIVVGPFGVDLPDDPYLMLHMPFISYEAERAAPFYDSRWYEDLDLLIASDYDYARYQQEPERYREFLSYYDTLHARWQLQFKIRPSEQTTGPSFWLYSFPDSLRRPQFDPSLFERLHDEPESSKISTFLKDLTSVLMRKGKYEKCEQLLREILSVEVENIEARNLLAQVFFNLGNNEMALLQVQKSLKINPSQAELFGFAGVILLRMGKEWEAELSFLKALQLNNTLEPAYEYLITIYTKRNDNNQLRNILQRYVSVLPPGSEKEKKIKEQLQQLEQPS